MKRATGTLKFDDFTVEVSEKAILVMDELQPSGLSARARKERLMQAANKFSELASAVEAAFQQML